MRFFIIWIPLFIIFLNMYPGTLSVDTPQQMAQAVGDGNFNNANPAINTLVIAVFVRLGMWIKDINLGVAMYTFFQFTLYSAVAVYVLTVLDKIRLHIAVRVICLIFFICPINMIYATGMWKDTFFAVVLLLNLAYSLDLFVSEREILMRQKIVLAVLSVISSLARNSGWTALLVGAVALFVCAGSKRGAFKDEFRKKCSAVAVCEAAGVVVSIIITSVIYPMVGIGGTSPAAYMYSSVQMQQLSRMVVDDACSESELELLESIGVTGDTIEYIKNNYDPILVDPIRGCYDTASSEFWYVWFRIGLNHPIEYFVAAADHTVNYWCPFSSGWLVDFRIFDNPYGIERTPLILKNVNLAQIVYRSVFYFIPIAAFSNSGVTFWMILLCIYICLKSRNRLGCALCMPYLIIYAGLFLLSYGCLFRYTYSAVLGMPLLLGFYGLGRKQNLEE